jgi:hypothetical protein
MYMKRPQTTEDQKRLQWLIQRSHSCTAPSHTRGSQDGLSGTTAHTSLEGALSRCTQLNFLCVLWQLMLHHGLLALATLASGRWCAHARAPRSIILS